MPSKIALNMAWMGTVAALALATPAAAQVGVWVEADEPAYGYAAPVDSVRVYGYAAPARRVYGYGPPVYGYAPVVEGPVVGYAPPPGIVIERNPNRALGLYLPEGELERAPDTRRVFRAVTRQTGGD